MKTSMDPVVKLIEEYLDAEKHKDAIEFAYYWLTLCHVVDDLIDDKNTNPESILKAFEYSAIVYSLPFYRQYAHILLPLVKAATNDYADSVLFEQSPIDWQKHYADVLRQNGNMVICAVIELCVGIDARRSFSQRIREISYIMHHTEEGESK